MTVLSPGCGPNVGVVAAKDARAKTRQQTVNGTALHTFTLHNTSATARTKPYARLGLAFLKGDVPAGSRIKVVDAGGRTATFAAAAAWNSWADGSLRSTADGGLVLMDGPELPAGGSRTYRVYAEKGAQPTSGFDPFAWLAAHGSDLTVAVTGRTGSATGPRPDLLFSLKTAIQTTTRREILCDTARFVRIKAWQKLPAEEHLICEYHLDFWLDGARQPLGLEFAPVLTQHWWVADPFGTTQAKERQTYDAVVRYNTTVLDTRARLDHAYYCRWASLRPQDDAQHARKHWIGLGVSQMPTVRVQYDDASLKRMMKAGYIPPFRLGVNYSGDAYGHATIYAPLGTNGHRASIAAPGGYVGRGMWGDPDAKLVSRQAEAASSAEPAWRASRVMAQAGLSVHAHHRDHRAGGGDTTNRLIPGYLRKISGASYDGLASPVVYAKNLLDPTPGITQLRHNAPAGGSGSFSQYDVAHACNYSFPMAFLEGESYLGDAAVSQFNLAVHFLNWNRAGADALPLYGFNVTRQAAQGIPNSSTSGYGTTVPPYQERGLAFGINLLGTAHAIRADGHPEQPFIKNFVLNVDDWLSDSFGYYPSSHYDKGGAWVNFSAWGQTAPWQINLQGLAAYQCDRVFDFLPANPRGMTGFKEMGLLAARYVIKCMASHPYAIGHYHTMWGTDGAGYSPLPDDEWPMSVSVTFSSSVATATPLFGLPWQNGDKLRIGGSGTFSAQTIPSGLAIGTLYHLVNVSGDTFQLAASTGGAAITIGNATAQCHITAQQFAAHAAIGPNGVRHWPGDDSYYTIAYALFEQAIGEQHSDLNQTDIGKGRQFFLPKASGFDTYAAWNYDGSALEPDATVTPFLPSK